MALFSHCLCLTVYQGKNIGNQMVMVQRKIKLINKANQNNYTYSADWIPYTIAETNKPINQLIYY